MNNFEQLIGYKFNNPNLLERALTHSSYNKEKNCSLVKIHLLTGRHHQIRVQLAGANHSLLGDQKYGDFTTQELSKQLGIRNVALCAARLHFNHPTKKKEMEFEISPKGLPFQFFRDLLCK